MAWTKANTATVVGVGVALVVSITLVLWPRDPRKRAEAKGERLIEKRVAKPVDMATTNATPVFSVLPTGFRVFNNVPLQIDGMTCLWGEGGASRGMVNPKEVLDVPLNQKFQTLYLYHKASFGSEPGTPVCDVVLHFVDGKTVTNRLLYGEDVLDWFSPGGNKVKGPTGPNSKLAWIGQMAAQNGGTQQLRVCMTAIENPDPIMTVSTVDFYSCKSRTVVCIMAMTAGKPGLMDEAAPDDDRKK